MIRIKYLLGFGMKYVSMYKVIFTFGISEMVFIGDRGMVKASGKVTLSKAGFKYIRIEHLVENLPGLWEQLRQELNAFLQFLGAIARADESAH